jgi:polyvinyl alcohol dehydrogenase (cytochrome)
MKSRHGALLLLSAACVLGSSYARAQRATPATPGTPVAAPAAAAVRGTTEGAGSTIFGNYCEQCHGKIEAAPTPAMLKKMTPEHIYLALSQGDMVQMAKDLTDQQKKDIAEWVGGRKLGGAENGDAAKMTNPCPTNSPIHDITASSWNGWSPGITDNRFQSGKAANMSEAKVQRLKVKWAFGFPAADSMYGQPTVVDGHVFITSDAGYLYSIDAATGCVHWSYQAGLGIRSAVVIGPTKVGSTHYAAFFGDVRGNVYSVDADSGKLLWKIPIDPQQLSRITAGTVVYKGRLYVAVASLEEPESSSPNYQCCQFRGMIAALDTETGKQVWKTYTLANPPSKQVTKTGIPFMGPAGVGVWGPMAIDPKRNAIYFGTGNTFAGPDVGASDAIMALNLDTGAKLWTKQDEPGDIWHTGCPQGPSPAGFAPKPARPAPVPGAPVRPPAPPPPADYYCEAGMGPDWDISSGAMIATLPNGRNLVVAGQKSGMVWAHDPDAKGELVWRSDAARGQITFGGAMDEDTAYFAFRNGGVAALRISDGLEKWYTPITAQPSMASHAGFSAAVSLVPGVVFATGLDGMIHAFNAFDGKVIWEYDTTPEIETVNGVKAHGGSIGSAGATIANGMLFVTSGYTGFQNGAPGNVLLAFSE